MIPTYDFDTALYKLKLGHRMEVVFTKARRSSARILCANGVLAVVRRDVRDRLIALPCLALDVVDAKRSIYRYDYSMKTGETK